MPNIYLRNLTNSFQDVKLLSLSTWRQANEIMPRDPHGPYVVTQEGYDPEDLTVTPDEFVLGKSGKWLSLGYFFNMPIPERRAEFVFGTAAEVIQVMSNLPPKVVLFRPAESQTGSKTPPEWDEMAASFQKQKKGE
jgi:hypothetical protein